MYRLQIFGQKLAVSLIDNNNPDDYHTLLICKIKLVVLAALVVLVVRAALAVLAVREAELFLNTHYNYHTASLEHLHYSLNQLLKDYDNIYQYH